MENTERDKKIIEQATSYLSEFNSHSLWARIAKTIEINTLDAFWDLHRDLTEPGETLSNLLRYKDTTEAISYTRELGAILRGERLEENK